MRQLRLRAGIAAMTIASMVALTGCAHRAAPRPAGAPPAAKPAPPPKSGSRYSQDRDSIPEGPPPDVSKIPEPVPKVEPRSQYGNKSPYTVLGESYRVLPEANGYVSSSSSLGPWRGEPGPETLRATFNRRAVTERERVEFRTLRKLAAVPAPDERTNHRWMT